MSTFDTPPHVAVINAAIEAGGLTQVQIAEALRLDQTSVSRRVRGKVDWSLSEVGVLAGLLGITVADLLAGSPVGRSA
jgi:predicted XRE-type DNA-binding protein